MKFLLLCFALAAVVSAVAETHDEGPGILELEHKSHKKFQTAWQTIHYFEFKPNPFGLTTVMEMNNEIQLTNLENARYHDMMVHFAVAYLPNFQPKRVLMVGAGDGMTLNEVMKHKSIERVDVLELDKDVPKNCAEQYGTNMFMDDPKVTWFFGDASVSINMENATDTRPYDLIIVDTSEDLNTNIPIDLLEFLHDKLAAKLAPHGVMVKNGRNKKLGGPEGWKYTLPIRYPSLTWPNEMYSFYLCSDHLNFYSTPVDLGAWKKAAEPLKLGFYKIEDHYRYFSKPLRLIRNGPPLDPSTKVSPLDFGYKVIGSGNDNAQIVEVVQFDKPNVLNLDKAVLINEETGQLNARVFVRELLDPVPYHEMLVHYPIAYLDGFAPKHVLIIGNPLPAFCPLSGRFLSALPCCIFCSDICWLTFYVLLLDRWC